MLGCRGYLFPGQYPAGLGWGCVHLRQLTLPPFPRQHQRHHHSRWLPGVVSWPGQPAPCRFAPSSSKTCSNMRVKVSETNEEWKSQWIQLKLCYLGARVKLEYAVSKDASRRRCFPSWWRHWRHWCSGAGSCSHSAASSTCRCGARWCSLGRRAGPCWLALCAAVRLTRGTTSSSPSSSSSSPAPPPPSRDSTSPKPPPAPPGRASPALASSEVAESQSETSFPSSSATSSVAVRALGCGGRQSDGGTSTIHHSSQSG